MLKWGWQDSHLPSSLPSCSALQLTPSPEMTRAQWSRSRSFRAFGATQLEGSRGDWILPVPHRQPHHCSHNAVMWLCRQLSASAPRGQGLGTPFSHPPWSLAQLMLQGLTEWRKRARILYRVFHVTRKKTNKVALKVKSQELEEK